MTPNQLFRNAVLGMVMTALVDAGYRVEVTDQDGGGLYVYGYEGEEVRDQCDEWVSLTFGNDPADLIRDFSTGLLEILAPVEAFCNQLDE